MDFLQINFQAPITSHKFEPERYQRKLNVYDLLIFFGSLNNSYTMMKKQAKTKYLTLAYNSINKMIL